MKRSTLVLVFALGGCATSGGDADPALPTSSVAVTTPSASATPRPTAVTLPAPAAWEPSELEVFPNAKRVAARIAEAVTTYPAGTDAERVAVDATRRVKTDQTDLTERISPLVDPTTASVGEVIYPQMSGDAGTTAGVMVLVRQRQLAPGARKARTTTRVLDVRLVRDSGGPWRVQEVAGVGGSPEGTSRSVSASARRALRHRDLFLPDSARWDIRRGEIDDALLDALSDAADVRPISVLVLRSGHPPNVWATDRTSAHTVGRAVDIYAIAGTLVLRQRHEGSPAFRVSQSFVEGGAAQVGSPWTFGARSFTDAIHADHVHLHWTPGVPGT